MRPKPPTIAEAPPSRDELAIIAFIRAIEIDIDTAIQRLSVPVVWVEEERRWRREPRERPIPEGWRVVG